MPSPKFYVQISPVVVTFDAHTAIWLNAFALNLHHSLKKTNQENVSVPLNYIDVRIETFMTRVSRKNNYISTSLLSKQLWQHAEIYMWLRPVKNWEMLQILYQDLFSLSFSHHCLINNSAIQQSINQQLLLIYHFITMCVPHWLTEFKEIKRTILVYYPTINHWNRPRKTFSSPSWNLYGSRFIGLEFRIWN